MLSENQTTNLTGIYFSIERLKESIEGLSISLADSTQESRHLCPLLSVISNNLETEIDNLWIVIHEKNEVKK